MRGPKHFQVAEQLLRDVTQIQHYGSHVITAENDSAVIAAAQVHATLALAAATALSAGTSYHAVQADMTEWRHAAGNQTAADRDRIGDEP